MYRKEKGDHSFPLVDFHSARVLCGWVMVRSSWGVFKVYVLHGQETVSAPPRRRTTIPRAVVVALHPGESVLRLSLRKHVLEEKLASFFVVVKGASVKCAASASHRWKVLRGTAAVVG